MSGESIETYDDHLELIQSKNWRETEKLLFHVDEDVVSTRCYEGLMDEMLDLLSLILYQSDGSLSGSIPHIFQVFQSL